ncbi:SDR family oxidoreductase [Sphingomonas bacterium]|uniref:SDR family NAD(P)-dependent oxidoreductase n=1 Tax=Sphingomonas bacterium TaxID=1895847 RepID=UPI0015775213|nr:SDR family NAD(P)-dependent oxidoreductase [Sphingomonas bacterium]
MSKEWALVTGASGGLGEALAREIASRGLNVALAARGDAAMQALASELRDRHKVETRVFSIDLSAPGSAAALTERIDTDGIKPDLLLNNAAFGMAGSFVDADHARLLAMLQLDVVTLTELTLLYGRRMMARGRGRILLVGSLASFSPCPNLAAYAAAKAYVLSLGEALNVEFAPAVGVTTLSPGLMDTGFNTASGFKTPAGLQRTILPVEKVARIGVDALLAGKSSVVAGKINKLTAFSNRLLSRHFVAKLSTRAEAAEHGS